MEKYSGNSFLRGLTRVATLALALISNSQAATYDQGATVTAAQNEVSYLQQGWTPQLRELAYFTPQGSRLMPYRWFLALERVGADGKFADAKHLSQYGWLHYGKTALNPDGLPIGFAIDPANLPETGPWVGLNCTACHTGQVSYQGKTFRIDGAPAQMDFGTFLADLAEAVKATRLDGERMLQGRPSSQKFQRFAAEVIGHSPSVEELGSLLGKLEAFAVKFEGESFMRTPILPAGHARVDALGQIINALTVFDLHEPDNLRPPSAPVSYPFLWLAPKLDFVQWTPVASNPISRNVGEVMGVYGQADFTAKIRPFASSALLKQLAQFEDWFDDLDPPRWPADTLGALNQDLAKRGKELFGRDCLGCHTMPPYRLSKKEENKFGRQFIQITRVHAEDVATDPTYTQNLVNRMSKTGTLGPLLFPKDPEVASAAAIFFGSVFHVVDQAFKDDSAFKYDPAYSDKPLGLAAFKDDPLSLEAYTHYNGYRFCPENASVSQYCPHGGLHGEQWNAPPDAVISFKAGPLFGVWATGPFLHNGSVPNVYELLSPPPERSKVFWVGGTELDRERLGFKSAYSELQPDMREQLFRFDTSLPGNHNSGHAYPAAGYSHAERMAVIEYLKDPGDWH